MHEISQFFVILLTESNNNQAFQIPHGSKSDDIRNIRGGFYHHKITGFFNYSGQMIEGG